MPMSPGHQIGLSRRKEIALAARDRTPVDTPAPCGRGNTLPPFDLHRMVDYDVAALVDPDIDTIGALARLQVEARRRGRPLCLKHASAELRELIALAGLSGTLPCREALLLKVQRQPEERKEARGVQEERDPADATR